ncbi:hypothetical protein EDD86DRAFT_117507 [Gorgonomyces haynaldii]|nr:hypothetical protein EDD86DRAFT_117507 [Gorgonomyces haynaldii]
MLSNISQLKKSLVFVIAITIICAILVPVSVVFNIKDGEKKGSTGYQNDIAANVTDDFDGLQIALSYVAVDQNAFTNKIKFGLLPSGKFSKVVGGFYVPSQDITLDFDGKSIVFPANQRIGLQDGAAPWLEFNINNYPFDTASSETDIRATVGKGANATDIPIALFADAAVQGFSIQLEIQDYEDGIVAVTAKVQRSGITKFFSVFVMFLLWAIAIGAVSYTATYYFLGFTEPVVLALNASLLFAVPGVRNTQPGIPSIGCTADVASFFWVMGLLGINQVMLLISFYRNKYRKFQTDLAAKTA